MNKSLSFFATGFLAAAGLAVLLSFGTANDQAWATRLKSLQSELGEFSLEEKSGSIVLTAKNGGRYRIVSTRDGWVELSRRDVVSNTYWAPANRVIVTRR